MNTPVDLDAMLAALRVKRKKSESKAYTAAWRKAQGVAVQAGHKRNRRIRMDALAGKEPNKRIKGSIAVAAEAVGGKDDAAARMATKLALRAQRNALRLAQARQKAKGRAGRPSGSSEED